jgi:glutathione S-transferase
MPKETELKIWGRRDSFNVQKVLWFLGELALPYEHIPAGGRFGGLDTPEFLAMNPHGRIPVIVDQGQPLWESHTILRYLAATYSQNIFWQENTIFRAKIESWMDWQQTTLQPDFLSGIFWAYYRTPEKDRDWKVIHSNISKCARHFILLNAELKNRKFLCGDTISLADITVGATLFRYFSLDIEKPVIPYVQGWYERLQERRAYRENVMLPFEDMFGRLAF